MIQEGTKITLEFIDIIRLGMEIMILNDRIKELKND
jgi:hypothetical protein